MTAVPDTSSIPTTSNRPLMQSPDRSSKAEARVGMTVAILTLIIASLLAVVYGINGLSFRSEAFFGAFMARSMVVDGSQPVSDAGWNGLNAGLARLDRVISINGQPLGEGLEAPTNFRAIMRAVRVGEPIEVEFLRPADGALAPIMGGEVCEPVQDGYARCVVTYPTQEIPAEDYLALFIIPFVSGMIVLVIGIITLLLRPYQASARALASGCALLAIFMTGLFDLNSTYAANGAWMIGLVTLSGALVSFALIFPVKSAFVYRNTFNRYLPVIAALAAGWVLSRVFLDPPNPYMVLSLQSLTVLSALAGSFAVVVTMLYRRSRATTAVIRDQSNTVLIGFAMSLIISVIWVFNALSRGMMQTEVVPINTSAAMPFFVLPVLSMAYAVLQYRSTNTDRILSQAITYGIMLFGLVSGYFLLVLSVSLLVGNVINAADPVLLAVVIFVVAVLFVPVRTGLQKRIDRLYFRTQVNYQARVESFVRHISSLVNLDDILSAYRDQIEDALLPADLFIFLPDRLSGDFVAVSQANTTDIQFSQYSPMIEHLRQASEPVYLGVGQPWARDVLVEKARLGILRALVIMPLVGSNRLNGFVVLAAPRSGRGLYTFDELNFLQNLTNQITVAIERAQVVDSLERRVRELDVLSQVSQAVNFSVDFDSLLELISTQISRLVESPNFYITLRDTASNELYHAFFVEDDERLREKENRRWAVGRDLFSQVVREGHPIRVANFVAEMQRRGVQVLHESQEMKAWMGVPLIAGSQALGVLSVGMNDVNRTFNDEQEKSLSDVASLAATSIDKSRLFDETNVRARQLAVLNAISSQIVASEVDLEGLLRIITESATDILNAEAGSLLLTTDDGTESLEFRVVSGGAGSGLVGVRVPAGKGLVGEVAKTGKPVIVYDVASDPRWAGELGGGSFHTANVIAVPLISQERVTGVLEVLNKRGGTFNPTDVDLLTTFAGQAAVAIENARLFQLTDLQLSERVSELETLERIDIELNRSLDLRKVAEITVNWALENSSATAGMIGLVVGEPPRFLMVYRYGYAEYDVPEGTEGDFLPLDRGIVSRVMRTRQAEVVPDVSIDPDYVPSLHGCISQATLPMMSGGNINALLILETNREPRLRLADMPFLQRLTEHASIAISNAQLYAELTRANQSKSEFVSFVAHELKNPLTSIKGYSDVLLGGAVGALSEPQRNFLSTIRSNAERMNNLVSDLNDVTKLQTNNMRIDLSPTDFRNIVTETLRPLHKLIEDKAQTLNVEIPDDLPLVNADQNRIIQVLTNLVSNAHKYTPKSGVVTLAAYVDNALRDAKGRTLPPMLHIEVRDTGIGMSEEDLSRLFTPYFRSENPLAREQPGTGLGLTITQGIVLRHGGNIWVESQLGEGTVFHFTLPLVTDVVGK